MKDLLDITIVIDRSGSMEAMGRGVIDGVNGFVDEQAKLPGEIVWTLVQFDDPGSALGAGEKFPHVLFEAQPQAAVPRLTEESFRPRGNTALFDAVCDTIEAAGKRLSAMAETERPDKVVFVIMTDGLNNASTRYTREKMNEMISRQRNEWNWKFIFLASGQDAMQTGQAYGIGMAASNAYIPGYAGSSKVLRAAATDLLQWRDGKDPKADVVITKDEEAIAATTGKGI